MCGARKNKSIDISVFSYHLLYYEASLITGLMGISLFYVTPIINFFNQLSLSTIIGFGLVQILVMWLSHIKIRKITAISIFYIICSCGMIMVLQPNFIKLIGIVWIFLVVQFFLKAQFYWNNTIPQNQQSIFFAKRLIFTNTPKFLMCLGPLVSKLII